MLADFAPLALITILAVLEQAYFSLQVIYARRRFRIAPPAVSGNEDFERVYRAHLNSSEYFPMFLSVFWIAGVFFSQVLVVCIGALYLYGRYMYFKGYSESALKRLRPMYFSATILWILIFLASLGVLSQLTCQYLGYNPLTAKEEQPPCCPCDMNHISPGQSVHRFQKIRPGLNGTVIPQLEAVLFPF
ncbi:leukotriene C4 synthase isoform X2 [Cetorhinus maximus]